MRTYAMGGFGCGNLGDEAIFEAMRLEFPDLIQIYVNTPQVGWDGRSYNLSKISEQYTCYSDLIQNGFPREARDGELIIGGGGILHSCGAVEDFVKVALQAKKRNMKISIRKIGAEYLQPDFHDITKDLCSMAYFISVRSKKSAEILRSIGVPKVNIEKDYTYNFNRTHFEKEQFDLKFDLKSPVIGIVTAGNDDISKISEIIRYLTVNKNIGVPLCNVVHIPHCRHFVDLVTNDMVAGEILWSSISVYFGDRLKRYYNAPFPGSVWRLLNLYTKVDGIIGMRYHSFIFSEILNIPLLGVSSGGKATAYFEEQTRKNAIELKSSCSPEELTEKLKKFFEFIK